MLAHCHPGGKAEAFAFAHNWLIEHAGDGQLGRDGEAPEVETEEDTVSRIAYIKALWESAGPITETPAQVYLKRSRGITEIPGTTELRWVKHLADRGGDEGAMVAAVRDNEGELVAIHLTHLTQAGSKSPQKPVRVIRRGPPDWLRRGGAIRLGPQPADQTFILTEGLEDALSAHMVCKDARVHACGGVGMLGQAVLPAEIKRVVVARDSDPVGSPACRGLIKGILRLLLQGCDVAVTPRPKGAKDLNDLLKIDPDDVRRNLGTAAGLRQLPPAEQEMLLGELAKTARCDYEPRRTHIAEALGWRASALDAELAQRRQKMDTPDTTGLGGGRPIDLPDVEPWPGPVNYTEVLNEARLVMTMCRANLPRLHPAPWR
jgi:hypothetical protein